MSTIPADLPKTPVAPARALTPRFAKLMADQPIMVDASTSLTPSPDGFASSRDPAPMPVEAASPIRRVPSPMASPFRGPRFVLSLISSSMPYDMSNNRLIAKMDDAGPKRRSP